MTTDSLAVSEGDQLMDTPNSTGPSPRVRRLPPGLSVILRVPRLGTWVGLAVVVAGFVLITVAWGDTAGTELVGDQLPYVMSAGLVGLALVCVGATAVAIDAKLADSTARRAQTLELRDALADLRAVDEAAL